MPTEHRVGCDDSRDPFEELTTEALGLDGKTPSLVVIEEDPFLTEFLLEDLVLGDKILDDTLLLAVEPAGQSQHEQLPGAQNGVLSRHDCSIMRDPASIGHATESGNRLKWSFAEDTEVLWGARFARRPSFFTVRLSRLHQQVFPLPNFAC